MALAQPPPADRPSPAASGCLRVAPLRPGTVRCLSRTCTRRLRPLPVVAHVVATVAGLVAATFAGPAVTTGPATVTAHNGGSRRVRCRGRARHHRKGPTHAPVEPGEPGPGRPRNKMGVHRWRAPALPSVAGIEGVLGTLVRMVRLHGTTGP
jgi:hypothetical protein